MLNGKKVFVGRFVPRKEREIELGEKAKRFTNCYIKNFSEEHGEEELMELFSKYGKISSLKVKKELNVDFSAQLYRYNFTFSGHEGRGWQEQGIWIRELRGTRQLHVKATAFLMLLFILGGRGG